MTALPRFRPVLVHDADREVGMERCPSEDVLILYVAALPDDELEAEELLEGWTPAALSAHLASCERCRAQAEQLGELTGALRDDRLEPPPEGFWDEIPASVMRSIDGGGAAGAAGTGGRTAVIPLRRDGAEAPAAAPAGEPSRRAGRRRAAWLWAAAAVLLLATGAVLWATREPADGAGEVPAPVAGEALVPTADEAAALAAELGIELATDEPGELAAGDVLDVDAAFGDAGWSSLRRDLARVDDVDALELALVEGDPVEDLIELDVEELQALLEALESRT